MIEFYPHRSVEEQKARLPQAFQDNYEKTVLDQIEIDGNVIQGYFEYSFLQEKSYFTQPVRSIAGNIENIKSYSTFLTPRLIIKYNMMNIEDYRKLMTALNSKNEFTVTCYDPISDSRVKHKMYAAPSQMPIIYQQYLMALGVQEFSIELIGTNNDTGDFTVTYNYNIPTEFESNFPQKSATQVYTRNSTGVMGEKAAYVLNGQTYKLSDSKTKGLLDYQYTFKGWNTRKDGSGFMYTDSDSYFIHSTQTLYAQWEKKNNPQSIEVTVEGNTLYIDSKNARVEDGILYLNSPNVYTDGDILYINS